MNCRIVHTMCLAFIYNESYIVRTFGFRESYALYFLHSTLDFFSKAFATSTGKQDNKDTKPFDCSEKTLLNIIPFGRCYLNSFSLSIFRVIFRMTMRQPNAFTHRRMSITKRNTRRDIEKKKDIIEFDFCCAANTIGVSFVCG